MWFRSVLFPLTALCACVFTATVTFHQSAVDSLLWLLLAIPLSSLGLIFGYITWERIRGRR